MLPRFNYYDNQGDINPFPYSFLLTPGDETLDTESLQKGIEHMLQQACDNGFRQEKRTELELLICEFCAAFVTSLSSSAANIDPLQIDLTPDAKPIRVHVWNYSACQGAFMENMVSHLRRHGFVYTNPSSKWPATPLILSKPGPREWRFTVDLLSVNHYTPRHQYPMRVLEHELSKLAASKFYAQFDFVYSYWQMRLHDDSQECNSFITPYGVFSPTHVLHGTTNAVIYLQSSLMNTLPPDLLLNILLYLNDCLLHRTTMDDYLTHVHRFLTYCRDYNWKLHPEKCVLFTKSVRWAGRDISPDGIRHDLAGMDALISMDRPVSGR